MKREEGGIGGAEEGGMSWDSHSWQEVHPGSGNFPIMPDAWNTWSVEEQQQWAEQQDEYHVMDFSSQQMFYNNDCWYRGGKSIT